MWCYYHHHAAAAAAVLSWAEVVVIEVDSDCVAVT